MPLSGGVSYPYRPWTPRRFTHSRSVTHRHTVIHSGKATRYALISTLVDVNSREMFWLDSSTVRVRHELGWQGIGVHVSTIGLIHCE
jgi:hypothetical protein